MTKRTRELNVCDDCHEPSFTDKCLYCRTIADYNKANEAVKPKVPKW